MTPEQLREFKLEVEYDIIPWIEGLMLKETNHLNWLKKQYSEEHIFLLKAIHESEKSLKHLEFRRNEYLKYVNS